MFLIISQSVVKYNTGATAKFAPRTANRVEWHVSGPWATRRMAERVATKLIGGHTVSATVVPMSAAIEIANRYETDMQLSKQLRAIVATTESGNVNVNVNHQTIPVA